MLHRGIRAALWMAPILALSALAGAASAQGMGNPIDRLLAADANHDGAITLAEAAAARTAQFARLDANHDGAVTQDEQPAEGGGRMITRADSNGDGRVTREEFTSQPQRGFDRFDTDQNGVISAAEIAAARASFASRQ